MKIYPSISHPSSIHIFFFYTRIAYYTRALSFPFLLFPCFFFHVSLIRLLCPSNCILCTLIIQLIFLFFLLLLPLYILTLYFPWWREEGVYTYIYSTLHKRRSHFDSVYNKWKMDCYSSLVRICITKQFFVPPNKLRFVIAFVTYNWRNVRNL